MNTPTTPTPAEKVTSYLVIYHGPHCNDGMTSAWVTHKALREKNPHGIIDIYPMGYGKEQADELVEFLEETGWQYEKIYVVDFSLHPNCLDQVFKVQPHAQVTILDHHKSAFHLYGYEEELQPDTQYYTVYGMDCQIHLQNDESGASLCWKHFYPHEPMPWLVRYVKDRDLWRFNYLETKALHMFINTRDKNISEWELLAAGLEDKEAREAAIHLGDIIYSDYMEVCHEIAATALECTIEGATGLMAQAEGQYASDVGNILAQRSGTFGMTFYESKDGESMICSLRSESEGDFDVEVIAKAMGGGGHKHAAGFKVSLETIAGKFFDAREAARQKELNFSGEGDR